MVYYHGRYHEETLHKPSDSLAKKSKSEIRFNSGRRTLFFPLSINAQCLYLWRGETIKMQKNAKKHKCKVVRIIFHCFQALNPFFVSHE